MNQCKRKPISVLDPQVHADILKSIEFNPKKSLLSATLLLYVMHSADETYYYICETCFYGPPSTVWFGNSYSTSVGAWLDACKHSDEMHKIDQLDII